MDISYSDAKSKTAYQDGLEFQDFVTTELAKHGIIVQNYSSRKYQFEIGENRQGIEIKLDNWCSKSKRLSIEVAEKSSATKPEYVPSGIYRKDNTWLYVQGNYDVLFVFSKKLLKLMYESGKYPTNTRPTIKTFYISFDDSEKYAALVIRKIDNGR